MVARGLETFEKKWGVEPHMHLSLHNDLDSARMDTPKPEVILGMPDQKLQQVKQVHKITMPDTQLVRIKPKKDMPTQNNWTRRGKSKQQQQNTLSQRTRERDVPTTLQEPQKNKKEELATQKTQDAALYKGHRERPSNSNQTPDDPNQKRKGNVKWLASQEHHRPQHTSPNNEERPYFLIEGTSNRPWYLKLTWRNRHEWKTHHRPGHHETLKKTHHPMVG